MLASKTPTLESCVFKLIIPVLLMSISLQTIAADSKVRTIYGADDRYDVDEYSDQRFVELAKSVAGRINATFLTENSSDPSVYDFRKKTLNEHYYGKMCEAEKFQDQIILPTCTGFLAAPDIIVTAGHCVTDQDDCDKYKWVFDYKNDTEVIKKSDVYNCSKILKREQTYKWYKTMDYAIIKLDRPVEDRAALDFNGKKGLKKSHSGRKTELVVIGHTASLPLKIIDGAEIKKSSKRTFLANTDTFSGNSGSPVFDKETGLVIGILVKGGTDYEGGYNDAGEYCVSAHVISGDRNKTSAEELSIRTRVITYLRKNIK
jgi:V8-like Glu-specific endopeptidase